MKKCIHALSASIKQFFTENFFYHVNCTGVNKAHTCRKHGCVPDVTWHICKKSKYKNLPNTPLPQRRCPGAWCIAIVFSEVSGLCFGNTYWRQPDKWEEMQRSKRTCSHQRTKWEHCQSIIFLLRLGDLVGWWLKNGIPLRQGPSLQEGNEMSRGFWIATSSRTISVPMEKDQWTWETKQTIQVTMLHHNEI